VAAGLEPPKRAYEGDAGLDLRLLASEELIILPHERKPIPTGVGFEIPSGWYGLICNRTSMGRKGLIPLAQVVDCNFTGDLTLTLHNTNDKKVIILQPGERVAQIVFMPVWSHELVLIDQSEIKKTDRGAGQYGSSGKF
jgi:dUTP pyrophosphatase